MGSYEKIGNFLQSLRDRHNVQICVKDFCGFVPINKELDEVLQPFLAHTNPYCMYMKSTPEHYRACLSMIRRMYTKCEKRHGTYFGVCHGGLGEYVIPIWSGKTLLGSINAGFFQMDERRAERRIRATCRRYDPLDGAEALRLYHSSIRSPEVDVNDMLFGLELLAEYLGQTYRILQNTHSDPNPARRYYNSSEDNILTHAVEYIRQNLNSHISAEELASFCHCSESYLSRIFKKRTGVNINVYINKVRMELAKNYLLLSKESMAEIAACVGFNDPNYFSRVFTQIIGIPPTEFRRRFTQDALPPDAAGISAQLKAEALSS